EQIELDGPAAGQGEGAAGDVDLVVGGNGVEIEIDGGVGVEGRAAGEGQGPDRGRSAGQQLAGTGNRAGDSPGAAELRARSDGDGSAAGSRTARVGHQQRSAIDLRSAGVGVPG